LNDTGLQETQTKLGFRSGFVALVGRPNVGKSTLLNALVGEQVAIATHRPQTTRTRIRGILNRPGCQIIFVDTPGIHERDRAINTFMLDEARAALGDVDLVVLLVEADGRGRRPEQDEEDRLVLDSIKKVNQRALLAVNKIDRVSDKQRLLPLFEAYDETGLFEAIVPISALKGDGLEPLLDTITERLPEGPEYFPPDQYTDQPERIMAAEFIREAAILRVGDEVPYSLAVEVEAFDDVPGQQQFVRIFANLYVERDSQKGILIGKAGVMLKSIGKAARIKIERLLGCRVHLDLRVKVAKRWSQSASGLRKVGYSKS
jgi:GTP-binding protein Era